MELRSLIPCFFRLTMHEWFACSRSLRHLETNSFQGTIYGFLSYINLMFLATLVNYIHVLFSQIYYRHIFGLHNPSFTKCLRRLRAIDNVSITSPFCWCFELKSPLVLRSVQIPLLSSILSALPQTSSEKCNNNWKWKFNKRRQGIRNNEKTFRPTFHWTLRSGIERDQIFSLINETKVTLFFG